MLRAYESKPEKIRTNSAQFEQAQISKFTKKDYSEEKLNHKTRNLL